MSATLPLPGPNPILARLRKAAKPIVAILVVAAGLWWLLTLDRVTERVRQEDVEMIDIAVPPPPPPPPEAVQPEVQPDQVTAQVQAQAVQPDPLSAPQPSTTNPPAGDLNSLLADPTAASGAFAGGARGQGGTGKGPMIGGTGRGVSGASRAYAESVMMHIRRTLQRSGGLSGKSYKFRLRVSVSPNGALSMGDARGVDPSELESAISAALRGVPAMSSPPPEGMPNFVNVEINQS